MGERFIEYMRLPDIARAPRNPKGHAAELISASMRRFGYVESITLDDRTGKLVADHGRLDDLEAKAAADEPLPDGLKLAEDGTWLVPVQRGWASADDAEAEAYLVASNEGTIAGGWQPQGLAEVLQDLQAGPGLEGTGFDDQRLAELLTSLTPAEPPPALTDPDAVPDLLSTPVSQPGDVWICGPHRVVCGDSRDERILAIALDGQPADMVWTDPPYGVDYEGKTADKLTIEGDDRAGLEDLLRRVLGNARARTRPGAAWYVCGPAGPNGLTFGRVLADLKVWRQTLVWVKDVFVLGHSDYHYRHELVYAGDQVEEEPEPPEADPEPPESIAYGWTPGAAHRPPPDRTQDTVWMIPRPMASKDHPTMKPVELIARAIRNSSVVGATVLDPFAGSGSTMIAAHGTGRRAALVERSPSYVDVICRRWAQHTGDLPHHASGRPHPQAKDLLAEVL